ncbi:MAG TPA: GGDEF domain-containing protein [Aquabacterium sp.]|uniref:GGDEF domain-containing protein n=1 Tax=Aquabacterium sp. TaxID=1872578 RepID=UPI002E347BE9|nr:GGDEF domain-containing protein [Aquabacterium sp.]HEX5355107.1 GGDEF domain-containing protein [Aquabacterium sp.]
MLSIDVYTCYAVSGAGSLVGLGLLAMVRTEQARVSYALGLFRWALLCLSALLCVQLSPLNMRPEVLKGAIGFAGMGVALLAWAFRQLNGRRTHPVVGLVLTLLVGLALWAGALLGSDSQYVHTIGVVFCLVSVGMAVDQGIITWRNGKFTGGDLALLVAACEFALNWVILLYWVWTQSGPYPSHWLYMPEWLTPVTGLSFALLPLAVSSVVFASVNDRLMQQLRARSLSDDLTGALSRRGLRELGERMVALQSTQATMLAVLMIDIDFFKDVNDRYGHAMGDDVLRHVTNSVRDHLREDALLARYGGEEFSVLLPVRSRLEAQSVAERVREIVELSPFETPTGEIRVTVSIGLAFHREDTTLEEDLARADAHLYQAKHTGRNRVVAGD